MPLYRVLPVMLQIGKIVYEIDGRCNGTKCQEGLQRGKKQTWFVKFLTGQSRQKDEEVFWPLVNTHGPRQLKKDKSAGLHGVSNYNSACEVKTLKPSMTIMGVRSRCKWLSGHGVSREIRRNTYHSRRVG